MAKQIEDVMTPNPTTLPASATITAAARTMRDNDVGDVVVMENSKPCGIVTDRDLVVRGLAVGKDPENTMLGEVCSRDLTTVSRKDPIEDAVRLMREKALRRLPVVETGVLISVVSTGDLALERDRDSALAVITRARPNR